jgi:uncharacterized membrane protein
MATLVVFKLPTADGAQTMLYTLENLQKQLLIQIDDGAILTWPAGAKKPKTKQLSSMTEAGALGGAFWGFLFGLLFFIPILGLAVGAGIGALMGHFAHSSRTDLTMIGVVEHYDGRAGMEESLISAIKSSWGENNE